MKYAHIIGWGKYLPQRILTNQEISRTLDTSHEWIVARTGIHERRIAGPRETTATLAFEAAARALYVAGMHPAEVDLIIVATSTPESIFPATACQVQDYLGAHRAGAFDLSAACSGFVYALSMGASAIGSGAAQNVVVVGAETMSRVVDWKDRGTCILFGDGAGAVVLKGSSVPGGVLASTMRSDGSGGDMLRLPAVYHSAAPSPTQAGTDFSQNGHHKNTISMNGRQVFRFATNVITDSILDVVRDAGLALEDVDLIIPHQANVRIIETAARRLKLPMERFYLNVDRTGNTSAASIPIALCDAVEEGLLQPDDNVVFVGFGGGLSWAATAIKWDVTPQDMTLPDREWGRVRYVLARGRSRLRQMGREVFNFVAGSPTPDARLRDIDRKKKG